MLGVWLALTLPIVAVPVKLIALALPAKPGSGVEHAGQILLRQIAKRCEASLTNGDGAGLKIELALDPQIGVEGYRIASSPSGAVRILGGDERGLIYGVGKFLRMSRYDGGDFTPGAWRGASTPASSVRGVYFATHFNNFYETAPIAEVQEYVDELALWGLNHLQVMFPRWHFTGFDASAANEALARLMEIMREFLRQPVPDPLGRRGDFGVNLCPSKPEARALLLKDWRHLLDAFSDVGLDAVEFWPYDEGGCGCKDCWPWGARGYPSLSRDLSGIAREKYPGIKVILSAWTFDTPPAGEWEGLERFIATDRSWVDYIQADSHEDFPRHPIERGGTGGQRLLNFPKISMGGQNLWGGYSANPLPERLQRLWNQTQKKLSGGFPYSEGIYEDLNKAICTQLY